MKDDRPYRYLSVVGSILTLSESFNRAILFQKEKQAKDAALALTTYGRLQNASFNTYVVKKLGQQLD